MDIVITVDNLKDFTSNKDDVLYDNIDLTDTIDFVHYEDRQKYLLFAFSKMRIGSELRLKSIDTVLLGKNLVFKTVNEARLSKIVENRKSFGSKEECLELAKVNKISLKFVQFSSIYYDITFKREI